MMDSDAKSALSSTIRNLRERLLSDLHDAVDSRYRMSARKRDANLPADRERDREQLEQRIDERVRARREGKKEEESKEDVRDRMRREIEKEAAYTLLNRLVVLRLMEEEGLSTPAVVDSGWDSKGYREFHDWAPALCDDETEGYRTLLEFVFDEVARDLPGLFGDAGAAELVPVPADTLRYVVEVLNDEALDPCWADDTTLGWVYQYWNDPEREELDEKLKNRGKIEPHEIAQKTQLFTERYMVEWLLQNSLGSKWLAICEKNGWTPECGADDEFAIWRKGLPGERGSDDGDSLAAHLDGGSETADTPSDSSTDDNADDRRRQHATERLATGEGPRSILQRLAVRRAEWREKLESGEVEPEEMMPVEGESEERWKYWVPREMPNDAAEDAPDSIRNLELLDPSCGSGHFLVIAFDLLFAMYREEARHRGEEWTDRVIVESIFENNLHGLEIDPRSTQIAAAALYVKARTACEAAEPSRLNLVAPQIEVANLPADDPALTEFREAVDAETELSGDLVDAILDALGEAYHLGSLLRVGHTVDDAIKAEFGWCEEDEGGPQSTIYEIESWQARLEKARRTVLDELQSFLAAHTGPEDLGLRLRGQQLANGVRFLQLNREDGYDVVVANPPYQGSSKMADTDYIEAKYEEGESDLYAAFLMRGRQLAKPGGISAMVTMRNWMFIKSFVDLRHYLSNSCDIRVINDLDTDAFEEISGHVVDAVMTLLRNAEPPGLPNIAFKSTDEEDDNGGNRTAKKRSAVLGQRGRHFFQMDKLEEIEGQPLIYWWSNEDLVEYLEATKVDDVSEVLQGIATGNNKRFVRKFWELPNAEVTLFRSTAPIDLIDKGDVNWAPYLKGAKGRGWFNSFSNIVNFEADGLELKLNAENKYGGFSRTIKNEFYFFQPALAYSTIGDTLRVRLHRFRSIFDMSGSSLVTDEPISLLCSVNTTFAQNVLRSLNPTVNFQPYDLRRLPIKEVESYERIFLKLDAAFRTSEASRESSVEFRKPSRSCWEYAQRWAQVAVDRNAKKPLPEWDPVYEATDPAAEVSFAVGIALGRFGADGEGVLSWESGSPIPAGPHVVESGQEVDTSSNKHEGREAATLHRFDSVPVVAEPLDQEVLPDGILYVSAPEGEDSLDHPACEKLHEAWNEHGENVGRKKDDLNSYLRENYFKDWVKDEYDKRPIYLPLTSEDKNFVAHVSIHRWDADTLRKLLAEHLNPELKRLEGRLKDMRATRRTGDGGASVDGRIVQHEEWIDELEEFIKLVRQCAEEGPPKYEEDEPERECDARYDPILDDGVMINSAALWPLLQPLWDSPGEWWNELATEQGYYNKHYDWSHLAARYWPTRVYEKCKEDPSLAVAHDCFWKYHSEKAYEWELRLKFDMEDPSFILEEEFPEFIIDEGSDEPTTAAEARQHFFEQESDRVDEIREDERKRREREADKDNHRPDQMVPVPEPSEHVCPDAGAPEDSTGELVDFDAAAEQADEIGMPENVRRFRKDLGIGTRELADRADLEQHEVLAIEQEERKPTADELYDIAEALGVSVDALESGERVGGSDDTQGTKKAARDNFEDR